MVFLKTKNITLLAITKTIDLKYFMWSGRLVSLRGDFEL